MVPDSLPSRNAGGRQPSEGERRLFAVLRKLPDDCVVYYEPVVHDRHPDFIVIMPEVGVLIIEVKGWYHAELEAIDMAMVTVNRRGVKTPERHPGKQAFDYLCLTMNKCEAHPLSHRLRQGNGRYENRLAFPFGYMSVLSNINRAQLDKGPTELAEIFPAAKTAMRDQVSVWETLEPTELMDALKGYFDPWWPFPKLTREQVDIIRSVIHPEIVLRQSETNLTVLDLRQEENARAIGNGHRVVYGVAGSGKTVLLIARAKLLAGEPEKRILLLCFNKLLASYLAAAVSGYAQIVALHFHRWGGRNGAEFRNSEEPDAYGDRLLTCLKNGGSDHGQFDAVLIDEAQDWPCSWFQCAKLALKAPETGDLLIAGDGSQSLYRTRKFNWDDAGIHARGRTINAKFDLDRNYRNTIEILRAAQPFSAHPKRGQDGGSTAAMALPVAADKAIRNGPEPSIIELRSARDESHYAAALIETWLRGGIEICGRRERVAPHDIGILYPRIREDAMSVLRERLGAFTRTVWLSAKDRPGSLQDDGVRILTIKGARGLQFRCVVLLWADLLPFDEHRDERSELYVAMTRAEDVLVILHSGHSSYTSELHANRSGDATCHG